MSITVPGPRLLPRRERALLLAALGAVAVLAWAYLIVMALDMPGDAAGVAASWNPGYFAAMLAMWAIMMAGMMIPSAIPAILLFAALRRGADRDPVPPALCFAAGYLVTWTVFSLAATFAQWGLSELALMSAGMASLSGPLSGTLFIVAGAYQLSPLKASCLRQCRSPAEFLVEHRREGRLGALRMGMHHGAYCVGCCWALMALLFAFGVMNLLWIAVLSAFVLAEKVFAAGPWLARAGAGVMLLLGVVLFNA